MEPVRYSRVDGRKASSKCSTVFLVMFVALCLVGIWMLTSSTVTSVDFPLSDNKSEVDEHASNTDSKSFQYVSDDALDANINVNNSNRFNTDSAQDLNTPEKSPENLADKTKRVDSANDNESAEDSKNKTNFGTKDNDQHKINDRNPDRTTTDKQEKISNKNSDGTTRNEKAEQSSNEAAGDGQNVETDEIGQGHREERVERSQANDVEQGPDDNTTGNKARDQGSDEVSLDQAQSDLLNEATTRNGAWSTQAAESKNENEVQTSSKGKMAEYSWKLCNVTAGADYIPCLDNEEAIKKLPSNKHYEHRERHCPKGPPTCLVRLPEGYRQPIWWPKSRDKVYYKNVPHTKLVDIKGHQNWVKVSGEYLTFPGGGTQFKQGALHYIDHVQEAFTDIAWGKRSRVILDVGCGVASFGGYLFDRDVLTMSLAPKDEHEAQVQFALERGIPAISAVMGTKRLPFPSRGFDVIHCARCRVPWHIEGGTLLLELNRLLRPGGFFLWSATPVYRKGEEDVGIWKAMSALTKSMCWKLVTKTKDKVNEAGLAIYQKPSDNRCYERRMEKSPPLCQESDDPDAAWNVSLQACMHRLPVDTSIHGAQWPEQWPLRLAKSPYWLNPSQVGVYGKPAPEDFQADYEHWKHVIANSYLNGMGINWYAVRNVMDMRAVYGGFAAALRDKKVWVMNVVPIDSPDTLPIIYDRGFFGIYHDWCESFSTYPRSYDLLHADHLFSNLTKRCKLLPVITEVDRILRPEGKLIVRDNVETIGELESIVKSMHWEIRLSYSKDNEGLLCVQKTMWRPQEI